MVMITSSRNSKSFINTNNLNKFIAIKSINIKLFYVFLLFFLKRKLIDFSEVKRENELETNAKEI